LTEYRRPWTPERLYEIFPNLADMRTRLGDHRSGGEQQMLKIAGALVGNPHMIFLDEPSEGLAPQIIEQKADATNEMKRQTLSVLLNLTQTTRSGGPISRREERASLLSLAAWSGYR
jgi:branched-chain amino acid transport system ATP-binding protein